MPFRDPARHATTPQNRGRFGDFDVLDQVDEWDMVTAGVVLARLALPEQLAFFTPTEVGIASPLLDLLLAQDGEPRVPVLALIDERLVRNETDGWHYDELPEDSVAWRQTLQFLDDDAHDQHGAGFAHIDSAAQSDIVAAVQKRATGGEKWHELPAKHVWSLWTRYACTAFYSHPWAWNEIGFPGPAYPRGYLNLGGRERWETPDQAERAPSESGR